MSIIIDGYNVLKTCGFLGNRIGPGTLERARGMLIGMLIQGLDESQRQQASIVFDSALRQPDVPDHLVQDGIQIYFASGHQDADEMIIEMIQQHSAPKSLVIVSSDHQIQTAATRRKATAVDSEVWFDRWTRESRSAEVQKTAAQLKTELALEKKTSKDSLGPEESQQWLAQFVSQPAAPEPETAASEPPPRVKPPTAEQHSPKPKKKQAAAGFQSTSWKELADRTPPAASEPNANKPAMAEPNAAQADETVPTVNLDDIQVTDLDVPELNLGHSMEQANLRHESVMPDDLDQWLEDFDDQFQKADLAGGQPLKQKTPGPPARKRPLSEGPQSPANQSPAPQAPPQPAMPDSAASSKPATPAASTELPNLDSPEPPPKPIPAQPDIDVDERQMERWNRQLKDTDDQIFPPGYAEDILFAETFETDPRLKRKRRP